MKLYKAEFTIKKNNEDTFAYISANDITEALSKYSEFEAKNFYSLELNEIKFIDELI